MKTYKNIQIMLVVMALAVITVSLPQQAQAQRFGHGGGGNSENNRNNNGGGNRPAQQSQQPSYHPAPQQAYHPQQHQQPEFHPQAPAPVRTEERGYINGGSRNIGNHDYNRHDNVVENRGVIHEDINVRRYGHEGANVYHINSFRGMRDYSYHPYHPFYWGLNWHPAGFFLRALAFNAFRFSFGNQWYYYDNGCYYTPYNGGYTVVAPPVGAAVNNIPNGFETIIVGNATYYYFGGAFYIFTGQSYQVVQAPIGAVITHLPEGAVEQNIDGQTLLVYNNTYYQPISENGMDAYEVVPVN